MTKQEKKAYIVGGYVRDLLRGDSFKDRDWVLTGYAPEELLAAGFIKVGADFPVFLHPDTREEYALARKERKSGMGYRGFEVTFDPTVSLLDDLSRRDFTINAMALDPNTRELLDPFGGSEDLESGILREVSEKTFAEDPLRVLRLVRFAARFDFKVLPKTLALAEQAVDELPSLSPERVYTELSKAFTQAVRPGRVVELLEATGALGVLLPEIQALRAIPQPVAHHPEGCVLNHVILCLNSLENVTAKKAWAVLLHDTGKARTNPHEWPKHVGHEDHSEQIAKEVLDRLKAPTEVKRFATRAAKFHMEAHRWEIMRPGSVLDWFRGLGVLRNALLLNEFLDVFDADWGARVTQEVKDRRRAYLLDALGESTNFDLTPFVVESCSKKDPRAYWESVTRNEACQGIRKAQARHGVRR